MKRQIDFWDRMDLPGESFPGQALIEITEERRILIEHHRGVRAYRSNQICVNVRFGAVIIQGSCLELKCMTRDQLVITGRIDSIQLERKEKP